MLEDWTWESLRAWGVPLGFLLGGAIMGWLFERLVLGWLRNLSRRTEVAWDDVAVDALRHAPLLWFTAAGAWAAARLLPLSDGLRGVIANALTVVVILSVTIVLSRAAGAALRGFARRRRSGLPGATLITNVIRLAIFILGGLFVLQALGISITPLVTGLGIGGLAVALALQPTLANTFAGLQIIMSGQVRTGDFIRLETGEEGHVTDIKWRNTTIKALYDDHEVVVPNSRLGDSVVVNYSLPQRPYWVKMDVGVHYDSDLEHVERVVLDVARAVAESHARNPDGPEPVLRFREFGDSSVNLRVRILADRYQTQFELRHEFIKRLHERFRDEGIEIPFPIRTLHVPKPIAVTENRAD